MGINFIRKFKHTGFTLAEVLLTLTIIGVIVALITPSLSTNFSNKIYVTKAENVYKQLSIAAKQELINQRVDSLAQTEMAENLDGVGEFLKNNLKVATDCGKSADNCFATAYKKLDKSAKYDVSTNNNYCVLLATGEAVCMSTMSSDSYNEDGTFDFHGHAYVIFDINGAEKPNIKGRDLFAFELYSDGKIGESYMQTREDLCSETNDQGYAIGCFSKIMNNGWKMDY